MGIKFDPSKKLGEDMGIEITNICQKLLKSSRLMRYQYGITITPTAHYEVRFADDRLALGGYPNAHMGYCGRLTYQRNDKGNWVFVVEAPTIHNEKLKNRGSRANTKFARTPEKAIELINNFVKPLDWKNLFDTHSRTARGEHRSWIREAEEKYQRLFNEAAGYSFGTINETLLQALIKERSYSGNFATEYLNSLTDQKVVDAYKERVGRMTKPWPSRVAYLGDAEAVIANMGQEGIVTGIQLPAKPEDLASDIQEKIALLKLMDTRFVPHVGYRACDTLYYLYE